MSGWMFLNLMWIQAIGGLLVILGVILAILSQSARSRKDREKSAHS